MDFLKGRTDGKHKNLCVASLGILLKDEGHVADVT